MQQIADWLNKLGMAEHAERFAEKRIEIDVLSELRDQDLERLGISLGHRRRMLRRSGSNALLLQLRLKPRQLRQPHKKALSTASSQWCLAISWAPQASSIPSTCMESSAPIVAAAPN